MIGRHPGAEWPTLPREDEGLHHELFRRFIAQPNGCSATAPIVDLNRDRIVGAKAEPLFVSARDLKSGDALRQPPVEGDQPRPHDKQPGCSPLQSRDPRAARHQRRGQKQ